MIARSMTTSAVGPANPATEPNGPRPGKSSTTSSVRPIASRPPKASMRVSRRVRGPNPGSTPNNRCPTRNPMPTAIAWATSDNVPSKKSATVT